MANRYKAVKIGGEWLIDPVFLFRELIRLRERVFALEEKANNPRKGKEMANRYKAVKIGGEWFMVPDNGRHGTTLNLGGEILCKRIVQRMNAAADRWEQEHRAE